MACLSGRVASSAVEHSAFNRLVLSSNLRRPISDDDRSSSVHVRSIAFNVAFRVATLPTSGTLHRVLYLRLVPIGLLHLLCGDAAACPVRRADFKSGRRGILDVRPGADDRWKS